MEPTEELPQNELAANDKATFATRMVILIWLIAIVAVFAFGMSAGCLP